MVRIDFHSTSDALGGATSVASNPVNPSALTPARILPGPETGQVLVFDDAASAESLVWLDEAFETLQASMTPDALAELTYFRSRRPGRCEQGAGFPTRWLHKSFAAVVDDQFRVTGLALAFGTISRSALVAPEAFYDELVFSWPVSRSWGACAQGLSTALAENQCVERYAATALEALAERSAQSIPVWTFDERWGETVSPLRDRLNRQLVAALYRPLARKPGLSSFRGSEPRGCR